MTVIKAAVPLAKRMAQAFSKNVNKIPTKNVVGGSAGKTMQKFKSVVDKIKKPIMNNKAAVGGGSALGAVTVAGAATQLKGKKPTEIRKIDPAPFNRSAASVTRTPSGDNLKAGSFGISQAGKEQAIKNKAELKNKFVEKNPPKEGSVRAKMREKNVDRFGKERVQKLVQKNQEFQAAKKSGNLAQFRKDNPKISGADRAKQMAKERLAKKAAMEEYTPYDIVLEYLLSSEQAATIEEANYVMTEMDAETIQSIVSN